MTFCETTFQLYNLPSYYINTLLTLIPLGNTPEILALISPLLHEKSWTKLTSDCLSHNQAKGQKKKSKMQLVFKNWIEIKIAWICSDWLMSYTSYFAKTEIYLPQTTEYEFFKFGKILVEIF